MAYRCTARKSMGQSAAVFMFDKELRFQFDTNIALYLTMALTHVTFLAQTGVLQPDTLEMARQHLKSQHTSQARHYDLQARGFRNQPGDRVWLYQPQHTCIPHPCIGPFTVKRSFKIDVYKIWKTEADATHNRILSLLRTIADPAITVQALGEVSTGNPHPCGQRHLLKAGVALWTA